MRPKGTPEALEARRRKAVALLEKGLGVCEVARQVKSSSSSVVWWREKAKKGGLEALKAQPHPHRPCRLSLTQKAELPKLLLQGPTAYNYPNQLWTLPRVARVIKERFGISYHPAHVWKILHGLGWTCQKPQRCAREQNRAEIQKWRKERWPHIKKRRH
jgi:transposase